MPTPTIACPTRAPSTAAAMASTMPSGVPGVGTWWVERMLPSSSTTPAAIFVPPMSTPMVSPMNPSVSVEPRYGNRTRGPAVGFPSSARRTRRAHLPRVAAERSPALRASVEVDALGAGALVPVAAAARPLRVVGARGPALLLGLHGGTVGGEQFAAG